MRPTNKLCRFYVPRASKDSSSRAASIATEDTLQVEERAMADELAKLESIPLIDVDGSDDSFFSAASEFSNGYI